MRILSLRNCLQLDKVDRKYYVSAGDKNPATGKPYAINPASGNWDDNYFAKTYGGGSSNPGGSLTDYLTQQKSAQQALLDQQQQKETNFMSRYNAAEAALPKASDVYSKLSTQLGIDPLRNAATALETTAANLPDTAQQRAQRFGLSGSQMSEYLATQGGLLAPTLTAAEKALGAREGDLNTLLSAQMNQNQQSLDPYKTEATFISDAAARATSLFSQQDQNTFTALLDKIKNDQAVSAAEVQQANDLAKKQQDYQNQVSLNKQFGSGVPYPGSYSGQPTSPWG